MDVTVANAEGLPEKAYISIRAAGDVQKQAQFKPGVAFGLKAVSRHFVVDVFEKVGSKQVSLSEFAPVIGEADGLQNSVEVLSRQGRAMKLNVQVKVKESVGSILADRAIIKRTPRHQAALEAKRYLDVHAVQKLLQGMVHELIVSQSEDVITFMIAYLQGRSGQVCQTRGTSLGAVAASDTETERGDTEEDDESDGVPDWSSRPGLGDADYPGFPADGSSPLPDLSRHSSVLARVLREDPAMYTRSQDVRTPNGVSLARCVKTGIDNRGSDMVKSVGLVAGDEFCYDVFREVFEPVIQKWHEGYAADALHPTDLDVTRVSDEPIDPTGQSVVSVQVSAGRNLSRMRMLPATSLEERCAVERLISEALVSLKGDLKGEYHPIRGSTSYSSMPGGMSEQAENALQASGLLFREPETPALLSAGYGRHWPQGRGIFASSCSGLAVYVNEVEHAKILSRRSGGDLKRAFENLVRVERALSAALRCKGCDFARTDHLGFLSSCPSDLGTGLRVEVYLRLAHLGTYGAKFKDLCKRLGLQACKASSAKHLEEVDHRHVIWQVSCPQRLGLSEVHQLNTTIHGCRQLIRIEERLRAGCQVDLDQVSADVAVPQTGQATPPATASPDLDDLATTSFPVAACPAEMPDLSAKHSTAAGVLRSDPSIYERLRNKRSPGGVQFARCIKPCFDNDGHPMITTVGAVAGDSTCYDAFRELFDPVIERHHPGFDMTKGHASDLDWMKVSDAEMDPGGGRVASVRVCLSRNLDGFAMPPACALEERRAVEGVVAQGLLAMTHELQGEYYPLPASRSYAPKPDGMSAEDEEWLDAMQLLVQEPDSQVLLSSGFGRDWPDGRGVFVGAGRRLVAWVNNTDHVRVAAMQTGSGLKEAFRRLCGAHGSLEATLEALGYKFAQSGRLGFLTACPSHLGTCLTASAVVRIPLLGARPGFRPLCKRLRLQARLGVGAPASEGMWEVLNSRRLGTTEVEQINEVIEGCRVLLSIEERLERREKVDLDATCPVAAASGGAGRS